MRGDDAGGHEQRLGSIPPLAQSFADERQHRRIGEMKQRDRRGEDEQRLGFEKHAERARRRIAVVRPVGTTCQRMIDACRVDREHGPGAGERENRHEPQRRGGRDDIAGDAGEDRGEHVAGMIERLVAPDPTRKGAAPDNAEADRG